MSPAGAVRVLVVERRDALGQDLVTDRALDPRLGQLIATRVLAALPLIRSGFAKVDIGMTTPKG